jgi:4-amino-4-deoxy-L-arabinose transferase-like glycosyltransferase
MKYDLKLPALLLLATCLAGYGMNWGELSEWDEARRGINALRMLQDGDFWNYRFLDLGDGFNTKPPLFTWLLAGSFSIFGVDLFALRLVSLIGLLGFVSAVFIFLRELRGSQVATLTVLILLLCNGIVGSHMARSGDTDMLFVFFLSIGMIKFYRFFERGDLPTGVYMVICLALAFLTKGLAVALVLPGLLVYGITKRRNLLISPKKVAVLVTVSMLTAFTCWFICSEFGRETNYEAGYKNLWEAMFLHDGVTRFTDGSLEQSYQWDFLLVSLDVRFSPWIYILYLGVAYSIFKKGVLKLKQLLLKDDFLLFSLLSIASVSGLLLISQNKHQWYIAPMLLFLAYPVALILRRIISWKQMALVPVALLFTVLFGMKVKKIHGQVDPVGEDVAVFTTELKTANSLLVSLHTPQHLLFHCYMINPEIRIVTKPARADLSLLKTGCENGILNYCLEQNN